MKIKEKLIGFYNKHKKICIIVGIILGVIILSFLLWKVVIVKYKEFYDNESKFRKAAMRYYEYHKQALPKKGESRELTLQNLYDMGQLDDLYVPNTRKMCDVDSWVRVYVDDDNEYKYITYLKCGKYHSRGDHTGPEITLNGGLNINVALGSKYEELGVKEVYDKKDKKIDPDKVVIDSSKVDTSKVGTYKVTYTAKDSRYNKTVVTRQVNVTKSLTDTVRSTAGSDGYYRGNSNNYVLFSGMLWRIINVNDDGTVKIILDGAVSNLRMEYEIYKDSNVDLWLNDVFYKALNNPDDYVVEKNYCVGTINSMNDYDGYCSESISSKIALLDIDSYYKTFDGAISSIFSKDFALANKIIDNYGVASFGDSLPDGMSTSVLASIRPVITLSNEMCIVSGDGSVSKPYKLNDYNYAKNADKINTRLIGEYVEYSGLVFRIIGVDSNKNVKLIMNNVWNVKPNNEPVKISYAGLDNTKFDMDDEKNPGYILNNDYLEYIDTKNMVKMDYEIPVNDSIKKYNEYETTPVSGKVFLPKTYELFASTSVLGDPMYSYIDESTGDNAVFAANTATSQVFELSKTDVDSYGVKAVITIKGDLRIESGKGTVTKPYKIK